MRTDSKLGVVHKSIRLRLILPEGRPEQKTVIHAPPGRVFTEQNVESVLEKAIDKIDTDHPLWEFRIVQVGPAAFNFIYVGVRAEAL